MLTWLLTRLFDGCPEIVTVEALSRPRRWNVESLKSSSPDHLDKQGLYAWYADAHGQEVLREAGLYVRRDGLAYVGMTTVSFAVRLRQQIRARKLEDLRDLRGVLTCVHGGSPSSDGVGGLLRRFTVAMTPLQVRFAFEQRVSSMERGIIEEAEPCLNREYVSRNSPNLKRLTELKERAKATFDDGDPAVDEESPSSPPSLLDRGFQRLGQVLALMRTGQRRPTIADADSAAPPEDDGKAHDTEPPRELTEIGRFRRDFWDHYSRRHPGIAPTGWASSNVRRPVETTGRRFSLYVAQDGVGVFFPRNRDESARTRAAKVKATVKWLRKKTGDAEMPDNGWSFLKLDSRAKRNWDRMADWLHDRRLLYERALRATAATRSRKRR